MPEIQTAEGLENELLKNGILIEDYKALLDELLVERYNIELKIKLRDQQRLDESMKTLAEVKEELTKVKAKEQPAQGEKDVNIRK